MTGAVEVLQARDVVIAREGRDVVRGVSCQVLRGQLWAVLGPNGAGKSTLLKAIAGLMPLRSGQVLWQGRALETWDRRALAQTVAWLSQGVEEGFGFRGLEYVLLGRSPHQSAWAVPSASDVELAKAAMVEADVAHLSERPISECSGGERRLLALARAFAQAAPVLLLDEPTAFLDLRHQVQVLQRVKARVEQGASAVVILHDVNLAAAFADHVLLLREGSAIAQGPVSEILTPTWLEALFDVRMHEATLDGRRLLGPRL
jgi:iron complex transport system ATP-binding protein